ncbi:hypothetical protein EDC19_1125 [Natranaerovirga hydrolytica]|uniref:Type II secretory pathway pseudopilin PulG n=1 Tax=Natranaerovirga hydrolytica TaxID=680378 RepID=A0A4R1N1A5_9FIRM|nr:hypothetical protein [Natranaerovirga hydrolytica]TCK98692.1 hypothetical protein EDC19_1125 [Natranaerovirga hydrolytica]
MKYIKSKNGYALVLTLIVVLFITMFSGVVMGALMSETKVNREKEDETVGVYLAQAGLEYALRMLEKNEPIPNGAQFQLYTQDNKEYAYTIERFDHEEIVAIGVIKSDGNIILESSLIKAVIEDDGKVIIQR